MQRNDIKLPDDSRASLHVPNILEKTNSQLGMLCNTLQALSEFAAEPHGLGESSATTFSADVRAKAGDSAVRIMHQIDNVVEDMIRWGTAASQLEASYGKLLSSSIELQKAQAFKTQMESLPSSRLPVHLHEYAEGRWGAYLVQNGTAKLIGAGTSIQDALNDFNMKAIEGEKVESPKAAVKAKKKKAQPKIS